MKIDLVKIIIENYRGIESCEISGLSEMNILVGPNGVGKSSLANAIARFLPALYGWPVLLRDGDFRFHDRKSAPPIRLSYEFTLSLSAKDASELNIQQYGIEIASEKILAIQCMLHIESQRTESDVSKGMLNEGEPAQVQRLLSLKHEGKDVNADELGKRISQLSKAPSIRVIGGVQVVEPPETQPRKYEPVITTRIEPTTGRIQVSHGKKEKTSRHAATVDRPNISYDGLRARLHQILTNGERAKEVLSSHPDLVPRMIEAYNRLRGACQFTEMAEGSGSDPMLKTTAGTWVLWSSLSAGERCLFAFAMLEEVISLDEAFLLIVEEPEANIHISLQMHILRELIEYSKKHQVFMSTHSTGFLELEELGENVAKIFLLSPENNGIEIVDVSTLAPANVLEQLGMTARSVGHPKFRILVEGISDAAFFQACLEQLVQPSLRNNLSGIVEFVVCGGPNVVGKYSVADSSIAPGFVRDDLIMNARAKLNLVRPGQKQFVLFDADGDSSCADKLYKELTSKLNHATLTVIRPWYRTLESLYSPELWFEAYPHKRRKKDGDIPDLVADANIRRWEKPITVLSHLFEKIPSTNTLNKRKAENGFLVAKAVREKGWATENEKELGGLRKIVEALNSCTISA